jgi:hypothetical protein
MGKVYGEMNKFMNDKVILNSERISFEFSHDDYCEYRPYSGGGRKVCPLRYVDYEDGYSTSYACILDNKNAGDRVPCRFKEEKYNYEGRLLVKEIHIE